MGIEDLVASQPTEESPSDATVMENEGSSAPQDNVDGEKEVSSELHNDSDGDKGRDDKALKAMQRRIDKLTASNKGFQESSIEANARAEAYENMQANQAPKTIQDLDVNGLSSFIARAENDPELEEHLPEAKLELQRKLVREEMSGYKAEQAEASHQQEGQLMTDNIIASLSDGKLQDQDSDYYYNASNYLSELSSDKYSGINKDQVLAVALAENEYLKMQAKGQTMSDRVEKNRNRNDNNLQSNNRAVNANDSNDLPSFLKETGPLSRSNQAGQGSLKEALSKLSTVIGSGGE